MVSADTNFWREKRAEVGLNESPAYQPNGLPLGQTGSQVSRARVMGSLYWQGHRVTLFCVLPGCWGAGQDTTIVAALLHRYTGPHLCGGLCRSRSHRRGATGAPPHHQWPWDARCHHSGLCQQTRSSRWSVACLLFIALGLLNRSEVSGEKEGTRLLKGCVVGAVHWNVGMPVPVLRMVVVVK